MILIADSGSTKTSWAIIENENETRYFDTSGFNPYIQIAGQISKTIIDEVLPKVNGKVNSIFFYGAGCSTVENRNAMRNALFHSFKKIHQADIEVNHDMLGAARALWFDETGIAAILGTGSNSCLYDGNEIIDDNLDSLGYILGDEGSGAYMGKILVRDFFYFRMPQTLLDKMKLKYNMNIESVLNHVYKMKNPNRWLASFAIFVSENLDEDYCWQLALKNFRDFFEMNIIQFNLKGAYPIGVVGSIGYYFRNCLEIVSQEFGFNLKKVIKSPIEELVKYHLQHRDL